jgi:hypothetical protein
MEPVMTDADPAEYCAWWNALPSPYPTAENMRQIAATATELSELLRRLRTAGTAGKHAREQATRYLAIEEAVLELARLLNPRGLSLDQAPDLPASRGWPHLIQVDQEEAHSALKSIVAHFGMQDLYECKAVTGFPNWSAGQPPEELIDRLESSAIRIARKLGEEQLLNLTPAGEIRKATGKAVGRVAESWAAGQPQTSEGGALGKRRHGGGRPRLHKSDPLKLQVYQRIQREHEAGTRRGDILNRLKDDKDFVAQANEAKLPLKPRLVKNALAYFSGRKNQKTPST